MLRPEVPPRFLFLLGCGGCVGVVVLGLNLAVAAVRAGVLVGECCFSTGGGVKEFVCRFSCGGSGGIVRKDIGGVGDSGGESDST